MGLKFSGDMLLWILAALTAIQLFIHFHEYALLAWPKTRSQRWIGHPRLLGIVAWESVFYGYLILWLALSGLGWARAQRNQLLPTILVISLVFFAVAHIHGYMRLRSQRQGLADASRRATRDSSVMELVLLTQSERGSDEPESYRRILLAIVAFDGFEVASLIALGWFVWSAIWIASS